MTSDSFIRLLTNCGYEPYSYSGRGMYGKTCVAVNLGDDDQIFHLGLDLAAQAEDSDRDFLSNLNIRTDSMGLGIVAYFVNVAWVEA